MARKKTIKVADMCPQPGERVTVYDQGDGARIVIITSGAGLANLAAGVTLAVQATPVSVSKELRAALRDIKKLARRLGAQDRKKAAAARKKLDADDRQLAKIFRASKVVRRRKARTIRNY